MVIGSEERPLRVAIVGAGPSGFYAATALLRSKEHAVCVDLYDRLPTPYGLVRGGVAPDHQRRGIGARLLDALLAKARELGCREAWVATESDNGPARALYRSHGGREDPTPAIVYFFSLTPDA